MAKKKRRAKKIPIIYNDGKTRVEYVDKAPSELPGELDKVQTGILRAIRTLSTMKRIRHHVLRSASFQLKHSLRRLPEDASHEEIADEIARLSFLMEDTLAMLAKLKNCRIANLEQARFTLQFSQAHKKRDPPAKYGSRARKKKEEEEE